MNIKLFSALGLAVFLAACSGKTTSGVSTGAGATAQETGVTPGSEADLVANVGDRVFFDLARNTLSSKRALPSFSSLRYFICFLATLRWLRLATVTTKDQRRRSSCEEGARGIL